MRLEKILAGFTKTIDKLRYFEDEQADEVEAQERTIAYAEGRKAEAASQLSRATRIRQNLEKLLEE